MSDQRWMSRALDLARRGQGKVHPNPMVGAVVVKNGRVIGEGFHERFGEPHAEVHALRRAGSKARGATLYVTLEPCCHWGKTPPCTDAVAASGVTRVVASMQDPNPRVGGNGFRALKKQGIRVSTGMLRTEALALNQPFVTWVTQGRPYVTVKAATSLDGKIATRTGVSRWITGPQARAKGHELRAQADAIAVGIETVLRDDPELTAHGKGRNPKRVVFDSRLRTPMRAKVLRHPESLIIFTGPKPSTSKRDAFLRKGVAVHRVRKTEKGLSVVEASAALAEAGVAHLLVEGGGQLAASFFEANLVDDVVWFLAPKIIGGEGARTAVEGSGMARLRDAWNLQDLTIDRCGDDVMIRGKVRR